MEKWAKWVGRRPPTRLPVLEGLVFQEAQWLRRPFLIPQHEELVHKKNDKYDNERLVHLKITYTWKGTSSKLTKPPWLWVPGFFQGVALPAGGMDLYSFSLKLTWLAWKFPCYVGNVSSCMVLFPASYVGFRGCLRNGLTSEKSKMMLTFVTFSIIWCEHFIRPMTFHKPSDTKDR